MSSRCPATADPTGSNQTPKRRRCTRTNGSAYAHAPAPCQHQQHRTTRTPPGPPPPPVPMTPPHTPTPTTLPKATTCVMDSGGSVGPARSSGSCESGPGQSLPSRAWSAGPAGGWRRTAAFSHRGGGCHRLHGKPCWPMRSMPRESTPGSSPRPRSTGMSSNACRKPSRRRGANEGACGTSPQAPAPAHTPPCLPTSVYAQTPAAPAAPREPRAPHNIMRRTPWPAAERTTAEPPAGRATQGPIQPNDSLSVTPCSGASLPAAQLATAAEGHAEHRPEEAKQTESRWTPKRAPTGTPAPNGTKPLPAAV